MGMPLPEELEWLETNTLLHEEEFYPEEEEEEDEQQHQTDQYRENTLPKPSLSIPAKSAESCKSAATSISCSPLICENPTEVKKRPLLDGHEEVLLDQKRCRLEPPQAEIEEEWLRYSPPTAKDTITVEPVVGKEKFVYRFASEIDGDFIPVTGPNGDRVYAKVSVVEEETIMKKLDTKAYSRGLTSEPINIMLQKVEQETFTKALQDSAEVQRDVILAKIPATKEQLWVDKYAPQSFTELLSDEQTNREVLLWLKQWDSCVFGSEVRTTTDEVLSALRRHSSGFQRQKLSEMNYLRKDRGRRFSEENFKHSKGMDPENGNWKGIKELWNKKARSSGPPEQKILLLCGPPGLGKTTLAHVAAKHSGYRVVEINASDDRSTSTIEAKILDVVQMNSVMADSKPKCLVIDEIDGSLSNGKGAVEVILNMVSSEKRASVGKGNIDKEERTGRVPSKRERKTARLSRPVICICNDLYAPALRPLRQVAKVHVFVQPTVSRVVSRLKYICNKEGLRTSSIALTALAEYTGCDIRSCLNTLQFLNKKKENLHALEISTQVVGRKDMSRSFFDIWKEIFQKRKVKHEKKFNSSLGRMFNEFDFLHSLISNRGDYDIILDGIHENILQLNYRDPVMQNTVICLDSLGVSDVMQQFIMRTQQTSFYAYQPAIAIAIHSLIAQVEKPNVEWPKSFHSHRKMLMEKMEILRSWHNKISPHISRHLSIKSSVEDSISPLLHILSPPSLRPVALHLLSEKEKHDLEQLVNTMVSYHLTYKNTNSSPLLSTQRHDNTLEATALSFDPPIDDFINFKDYRSCHYVLALAMKQVLLHEVEKRRILQERTGKNLHPSGESEKEKQALERGKLIKLQPGKSEDTNKNDDKNLSASKDSTAGGEFLTIGATKKASRVTSGFFDRFRTSNSKGFQNTENAIQNQVRLERDSRPLLFKFNEGFTNAVKRPVRIREFLLW